MMRPWIWIVAVFSLNASAKTFQNDYIRFDLPPAWSCSPEGAAVVCSPDSATDAREALIVATAKIAAPEDNLKSFAAYLSKPKTLITKSKTSLSRPMGVSQRNLDGLAWVQAVHLGSEVPGFITRYLATVKGKLAVLLSFSADQDNRGKFEPIFENTIRTVRIDVSEAALKRLMAQQTGVGQGKWIGSPVNSRASERAPSQKTRRLIEVGALASVGLLLILAIMRKFV